MERLRQEALDLAGARHGQLVSRGQFVHAQNRDDVAEFLVALQRGLHGRACSRSALRRSPAGRSGASRVERIHGRVDAQRGDVARQHDGGVQVLEGGRGDGSVKSSAGTYTAWIEVIEPVLVDVMRSCRRPISSASVGW